eukprot:6183184-Pleurochrysis_carterae.AAC.1
MRTCGALALRSLSSGVPVAPWQTSPKRPRPGATPVGAPSPRARACAQTIGSRYHIPITLSLPARTVALGRFGVISNYVVIHAK